MTRYAVQPWMGAKITNEWDNTTADGDGTHTGTDRRAAQGTAITSPVAGTVIFVFAGTSLAGVTATFGWRLRVRDAFGRQHGFAHLSRIDVAKGQKVQVGTQLALSGGALTDPKYKRGAATGPHIHWGVYSNDTWTLGASENPVAYLNARIAEEKPIMTNRTTVAAGANVRSQPTTAASIATKLKGNWGYNVLGYVTGALYAGSTDWFVTDYGYVHRSAWTDPSRAGLSDLTPVAPPVVVPPVVTPPTTGGVTKAELAEALAASEARVLAAIAKVPVPPTPAAIAAAVDDLQKQAGH